jgi:hypothetical protein
MQDKREIPHMDFLIAKHQVVFENSYLETYLNSFNCC